MIQISGPRYASRGGPGFGANEKKHTNKRTFLGMFFARGIFFCQQAWPKKYQPNTNQKYRIDNSRFLSPYGHGQMPKFWHLRPLKKLGSQN
jgi:hypothetical protein